MWHRLTTTASVRPIRLHDARHSMAVITKWLGHADASITAKINAHSQDDELRATGQTLGGVVTHRRDSEAASLMSRTDVRRR